MSQIVLLMLLAKKPSPERFKTSKDVRYVGATRR